MHQWKHAPVGDGHLVEESILGRRTDAEMAAIVTLRGLAENVRR